MDESAAREGGRAGGRDPVSRSAEFVPAALALGFIVFGLLLRVLFADGSHLLASTGAGFLVAGLCLELYARGVGAWAARRLRGLAVLLAVIGSPAVLWHALTRRRGPLAPELGGLVALLLPALAIVLVWAQAS